MYRVGRARLYITIIVAAIIESTLLSLVTIGGIRPNLMLVLVIFIGLHSDWNEALEAGIVGGILRGVMGTGSIGMNLVILGLCGLSAGYCKNKVFKENFLTQILLTFLIALAFNISTLFIEIAVRDVPTIGINMMSISIKTLIVLSIYTSLFSPPTFFCLKRLLRVKEANF